MITSKPSFWAEVNEPGHLVLPPEEAVFGTVGLMAAVYRKPCAFQRSGKLRGRESVEMPM